MDNDSYLEVLNTLKSSKYNSFFIKWHKNKIKTETFCLISRTNGSAIGLLFWSSCERFSRLTKIRSWIITKPEIRKRMKLFQKVVLQVKIPKVFFVSIVWCHESLKTNQHILVNYKFVSRVYESGMKNDGKG